MAFGALGPQPHQIGNQAYFRSGGGGAKLLLRRPYRPGQSQGSVATYNEVVPAGANYVIVRCFGSGGDADGTNSGGAGGAFAREDRPCTPGQAVAVSVPSSTYSTRVYTTFSLAGTVICSAESGLFGNSPGTVAGSIGTVRAAGGGVGQPGTNGGPSGSSGTPSRAGGGAGGEAGAPDELIAGGAGGNGQNPDITDGQIPGGGAGFNGRFGAKGYCVAEYWSGKP